MELESVRPSFNAWTQNGRRFPKSLKKQKNQTWEDGNSSSARLQMNKKNHKKAECEELPPPTLEERLLMLKARTSNLPSQSLMKYTRKTDSTERSFVSHVSHIPKNRRFNENISKVLCHDEVFDDNFGRLRGGGGEILNN